jgi:multimeric flavodoxin WrbA
MSKAVVLFASPHKDGHTAKLLDSFMNHFSLEYEYINLYDCTIRPCIDCKACARMTCPYNSDDMGIIIKKIESAEIIICATPIYFNHVPSPFKAMMDRCQQFYLRKATAGISHFEHERIGILLTTAGSDDSKVTDAVTDVFQMFFHCFETKFIEHIAKTNTDYMTDYNISQIQFDKIKKYLVKTGEY